MTHSTTATEANTNEPQAEENTVPVTVRFTEKQLIDMYLVIRFSNLLNNDETEDDDLERYIAYTTMRGTVGFSESASNVLPDEAYEDALKQIAALKKARAGNSATNQ